MKPVAGPKTTPHPLVSKQVLVRLPEDLAERFACFVPSRKRSRFLIDLLRRELDRESYELSQAAKRLTELESKNASTGSESDDWVGSSLVSETDDFDPREFERQFQAAQRGRKQTTR